jgi:energy-coupling factor transport system ATP-binding protein
MSDLPSGTRVDGGRPEPAQASPGTVLRASIRECTYPGALSPALAGIDLELSEGDFVVVVGPAAAGKTTFCHCLTGAIPKMVNARFDGEVEIAGQNLADLPLPRVSPLAGMVLQSPRNQLFSISVAEDVAFGPENLGLPAEEVRRRMTASMEFTSVQRLAERFSHLLSGGESQRVVLSAVLALDAGIFIFDQPAGELDPVGRRQVYANIRRLNQEAGKTVVLVEDRLEEVLAYATRVLLLESGRLVMDAEPRDFVASDDLAAHGVRPPAPAAVHREMRARGRDLGACPLSVEELIAAVGPTPAPRRRSPPGAAGEAPSPGSTAAPAAAVEVTDVRFRYPTGEDALSGVSLAVRRGQAVAVVGQNGAGKTTLAKHLIGLLKPMHGSVRVLGHDLARVPVHTVSQWVGFVFQDPDYQIFNDTCLDEVAYGALLRKIPREQARERARRALERVGLRGVEDLHPYVLSRGQRQMLAVASILAMAPPILVVDEPTTGLDHRETLAMVEVLRDYQAQGGTLLVITHDISVATSLCQRIVAMDGGRAVLDIPIAGVSEHLEELASCGVLLPDLQVIVHELGLPGSVRTAAEAAEVILERTGTS